MANIREKLAQLFASKEMPMTEFMMIPAAIDLVERPEIIERLSCFEMPEITKLVCGSDELLKMGWAERYRAVAPLYRDTEKFDPWDAISPYLNSVDQFASEILRYSDRAILTRLKNFFDGQKSKLDRLRKERKSLKKKMNRKEAAGQNTVDGDRDNGASILDGLTAKETETRTGGAVEQAVPREIPIQMVPSQDELDIQQKEKNIEELERQVSVLKLHSVKIDDFIKKLDSPEVNERREQAYEAVGTMDFTETNEFLWHFIDTGEVLEEMRQGLKNAEFCEAIVRSLGGAEFHSYSIPVMAKLYEEGLIDLSEGVFHDFLLRDAEQLCIYLIDLYETEPASLNDPDKRVFFDMAIDTTVNGASQEFFGLWNRFVNADEWARLACRVAENYAEKMSQAISRFFFDLCGKAAVAASDFLLSSSAGEMGISAMEVCSEILSQERQQQKAVVMEILRRLEQERNRIQRKLNIAERKLLGQSQELFSAVYDPVSQIEELAENLRGSDETIKCTLIAGHLINLIVSLRDGLDIMGVHTLVDPVAWQIGREADFDPDIHCFTVGLSSEERPKKVHVRTMGFRYRDDDGSWKQYPAEVYTEDESRSHGKNAPKKQIGGQGPSSSMRSPSSTHKSGKAKRTRQEKRAKRK